MGKDHSLYHAVGVSGSVLEGQAETLLRPERTSVLGWGRHSLPLVNPILRDLALIPPPGLSTVPYPVSLCSGP